MPFDRHIATAYYKAKKCFYCLRTNLVSKSRPIQAFSLHPRKICHYTAAKCDRTCHIVNVS